MQSGVNSPQEIAAEIRAPPAESCAVGERRAWNDVAAAARGFQGAARIGGIPQRDGPRGNQREAVHTTLLGLGRAIIQPSKPVEANGSDERIAGLSLTQFRRLLPAKLWLFQPGQGKEGPLVSSTVPRCRCHPVLPREGVEALQYQRGADRNLHTRAINRRAPSRSAAVSFSSGRPA